MANGRGDESNALAHLDELIEYVDMWNKVADEKVEEKELESGEELVLASTLDILGEAKHRVCELIRECILEAFAVLITDEEFEKLIVKRILCGSQDPITVWKKGTVVVPCQALKKYLQQKSIGQIARELGSAMLSKVGEDDKMIGEIAWNEKGYINIFLKSGFLGRVLEAILNESNSFVGKLPGKSERVMVEYSQPNTHKAFHIGHMRNATLGDCLWRVFDHCGFDVIPANYFGDEGTHIAKCLWFLKSEMDRGLDLSSVAVEERGEFLGLMYAGAVAKLDLSKYTKYPLVDAVVGRVVSMSKHEMNPKLHVVDVRISEDRDELCEVVSCVCGGTCYGVGDYVAFQKGRSKEVGGVVSHGIIMSMVEAGVHVDCDDEHKEENEEHDKSEPKKPKGKGKNSKKSKKRKKKNDLIWVLNDIVCETGAKCGDYVADVGSLDSAKVYERVRGYHKEVEKVLATLEEGDERNEWTLLWKETRQWSLDEFARIYAWLGCRFDVDYFESECSEGSQLIVDKYLSRGVFVESAGCVGCDLGEDLGFCMLRKSNGSGLYATKDLFLAQLKFEKEKVDRSIYVVDSAQTHHFKQVFATLKKMGYKQAEKCHHEAYGRVQGMSSRSGQAQLFSSLKGAMEEEFEGKYLHKLRESGEFKETELSTILHACCVGSIRYGMLNHDTGKDIVFNLSEWLSPHGNTGVYLMYQYARMASIERKVAYPQNAVVDYSLLDSVLERDVLMNLCEFQKKVVAVVENGDGKMNPSGLCTYLFGLCFKFSRWYCDDANNIRNCVDANLQATRLNFVKSIAQVLKTGLGLLGIPVVDRM